MNRPFIIIAISFCFLGTTFIIKEGGVEVGRWEEPDGNDEVQIIENDKPARVSSKPQPTNDTQPPSELSARRSAGSPVKLPEGPIAEWKVSGKLIDIITLKRLSGGEIIFQGPRGIEPVTAKVYPEGGFSARLPQLKKGYYSIEVKPLPGYGDSVNIMKDRSFSKIPYKERLTMRGSVRFGEIGDFRIDGNTYDMELGLFSLQSSEQERKDYQKLVLGVPEA